MTSNMPSFFQTSVESLKGVGGRKAEILKKELQIFTLHDLMYYFPYKYVDKSRFYRICEIPQHPQAHLQIKGVLTELHTVGERRGRRLVGLFRDDSGSMELVWFNGIAYMEKSLKLNHPYIVFGKPQLFGSRFSITHPEMHSEEDQPRGGISVAYQPFYNTTEKMKRSGLDSRSLSRLCLQLLNEYGSRIEESLPRHLLKACRLMPLREALTNIHFPQSGPLLQAAQYRLKFDEMFFLQLQLLQHRQNRQLQQPGFPMPKVGTHFHKCYDSLPYDLTDAQKKVIREIRSDLVSGRQMNRLLQGDVGSGKTITALLVMLMVIDNGYQACLMAPTEILAEQHFESISRTLADSGLRVELLTGSTKPSVRKEMLESLAEGRIQLLIGTHTLIEEKVAFKSLGLAVIDEQHRFGVEQRAKLWRKNNPPPHVLIMTATPIPRTLSMTLYGDLHLSIIDEPPKNRKPILTYHYSQRAWPEVYPFVRKQIQAGRQVFVVFPLIEESEALDLQNLMEGYEGFSRDFPEPYYHISLVHGRMDSADKNREMERFATGKTQLLLATSVIEVGIDIPNASVIIIENAERFGLSQLHQLRGRVGRGSEQSYCILLSGDKLTTESRRRIQAMVETNNGFELADFDLKLRGPGDISGTRQSGMMEFRLTDLAKDAELISYCRNMAQNLLKDDPTLQKEENREIAHYMKENPDFRVDYLQIS